MNTKILGIGQIVAAIWASYRLFVNLWQGHEALEQILGLIIWGISLLFLIYLIVLDVMILGSDKNVLVLMRNMTFGIFTTVSFVSSAFIVYVLLTVSGVVQKRSEWFIEVHLGTSFILVASLLFWMLIRIQKYFWERALQE